MRLQPQLAVIALLAWTSAAPCALAQETVAEQPPAAAAAPASVAPATAESKPQAGPALEASRVDTFMLRDSKGNLVPVLDLPFEEFERLLRLQRGVGAAEPPPYTIDSLTVSGQAKGDIADLRLTATIRVRKSGWVRVPLGLENAILREPAKYQGPGEHLMGVDAAEGYVCWLKGPEAEPHVVTLQLGAVLTRSAGQSKLALSLPPATESSLRITVPEARAEASLTSGVGLVSGQAVAGGSEVAVLGATGDVTLAWQAGRDAAAAGPLLLESAGEITVRVDGENRISSEARLRVRSFSGALDAFQVRLPPGMELVSTKPSGYSLSVVPPAEEAQPAKSAAEIVQVKFERPITGVGEIRLLADWNGAAPGPLMPARFEVLGAVRQRGTIDFVVEGDWLLEWKEDSSVRRLDLPADATTSKLVARHEFSRQPCGLELTVAARPSRVSIEPVHVAFVDSRQVRLESSLKVRLRGARSSGIDVQLAGWTIDRVTPSDLFEIPVPGIPGSGLQRLEFRQGAGLPSEFELKLEAHRSHDPAMGEISFPLPRPIADVVVPAAVIVVPADNVELTPLPEKISGLALDPSAAPVRVAAHEQPPVVYRDLGAEEPAFFTGGIRVRTRWSTAGARAVVQIEKGQMHVEQRIDYRIAFERRRSFEILVPRGALLSGPFSVSQGPTQLTPVPLSESLPGGDASRFQVVTPEDQIGLCQLVVKYDVALPKWDPQKPVTLTVPLIIPAEEPHQQVGGQQIEFVTSEPWRVEADPAASDEFSRPTPTGNGLRQAFAWSRVVTSSRWILEPSQAAAPAAVEAAKLWIQTWMVAGVRQERAVFRLTTSQDQVRFRLPVGPQRDSVRAGVNGQAATLMMREPASVTVDLPAAARGRETVVELWYALPHAPPALFDSASMRPPLVESASPPRRVYWQLCLAADEHLIAHSSDWVAEMQWSTGEWPLAQRASLDQEQLEIWIGASRQDALPRGANTYLFSTLGETGPLEVTSANRRTILVAGAGAALALGLAIVHLRAIRRPDVALVLAVFVATLGLMLPAAGVLLAQTAVVGLAVALAAAAWSWAISGKTILSTAPASTLLRAGPDVHSTEAAAIRGQRSAPRSTASAVGSAVGEQSL